MIAIFSQHCCCHSIQPITPELISSLVTRMVAIVGGDEDVDACEIWETK